MTLYVNLRDVIGLGFWLFVLGIGLLLWFGGWLVGWSNRFVLRCLPQEEIEQVNHHNHEGTR